MKTLMHRHASVFALLVALGAAPGGLAYGQTPARPAGVPAAQAPQNTAAPTTRSPEQQRQEAERSAQGQVNQDATAVISETRNALDAIARKDKAAAIAALERATGKANILLARNPLTALIPESVEVVLHDTAPTDRTAITAQTDAVLAAINRRDYALARVLLDSLRSEIRIRTSNVPLATYPVALREAARLLEAGQNDDAAETLRAALTTVVIIDRAIALPLIRAADAIAAAQDLSGKQKAEALRHLAVARTHWSRRRRSVTWPPTRAPASPLRSRRPKRSCSATRTPRRPSPSCAPTWARRPTSSPLRNGGVAREARSRPPCGAQPPARTASITTIKMRPAIRAPVAVA